jgi:hypothetical protein
MAKDPYRQTKMGFIFVRLGLTVVGVWLGPIRNFNIRSISDQSIPDAGDSNITILPLLMPTSCHEFVFWTGLTDR